MHQIKLLVVTLAAFQIIDDATAFLSKGINLRPIIGILSQEYFDSIDSPRPNGSYIAASYVKAVESAGARVVPIFIGRDLSYYERMVNSVNGILLPGGGIDFWAKGGYGEAARILFDLTIHENQEHQNRTLFPLYGVCLGFEALALASGEMKKDVLEPIKGTNNIPLTLRFEPDFEESSLFSKTPKQIIFLLKKRNITSNHHSKCFTEDSLKSHNLTNTWRILTTSQVGPQGKRFISSMEHHDYPQIFGTQFHPEKPAFEWNKTNRDVHSLESLIANRWFVDYFVAMARHNHNKFMNEGEERRNLIYNYQPIYSAGGQLNLQSYYTGFEQIYVFQ